jgi:osmotically-inducible protein OsmY
MRSRDELALSVREAIATSPHVHAEGLRVLWLDDETLAVTGEVASAEEKRTALQLAHDLAPDAALDDGLTVARNRLPDDHLLARQAQEALARAGLPPSVGVQVRHGAAFLVGQFASLAERDRAIALIGAVPGIRSVSPEQVSPRQKERVGPEVGTEVPLDEATVIDQVLCELRRVLPPGLVTGLGLVNERGNLTVRGFVKTKDERSAIGLAASRVSGVASVRNWVVVMDGSAGHDEALEARIRHELGAKRDHVSPVDVKVFVVGDTAYLWGQLDFPEQALEAEAIARKTSGIAHVFTDLVVTERHFRPSTGEGHAVEDANRQLRREGLDAQPD